MALLNRNDGLIVDATTINAITGTLQLQFTRGTEVILVNVNTDKLSKADFTLPDAATVGGVTYDGFRLNGGATAISAGSAVTGSALFVEGLFGSVDASSTYTIDNGVGKFDIDNATDQNNIKDLSIVHGLVLSGANLDLEDGAIVFTRTTGTAATITTEGTTLENTTINGGSGKAMLRDDSVNPAIDKIVILDDLNFPFDIATADNIELSPIGSAVIFS